MTRTSCNTTRIDVGVLGATGMVGQQFIKQLADHPWFRPAWLGASERSEGKSYADAASWRLSSPMPDDLRGMRVDSCTPGRGPHLMFSALDANAAKDVEPAFAQAGHLVISNARSYRMDPLVPLLIPEVNRRSPRAAARSTPRTWLARRDRHQSQLLDRRALDGARAAAPVRHPIGDGHDASGGLRRRLSWRRIARHSRQRGAGDLWRGRKDRERDAEDSRCASRARE